ncbi:hypothetical protein LJC27_04375 [Christensenellaceae bacterium OttesenSCG-928-M15]|nr:hypothetical protein [Christensenellaceae bacterium OttesenSCG-928-M15]
MQDKKITALCIYLPEFDQRVLNMRVNFQLETAHKLGLNNCRLFLDVGGDPTSPFQSERMNLLAAGMADVLDAAIVMVDDPSGLLPVILQDYISEGVRFITLAYNATEEKKADEVYDACAQYWKKS